MEYHLFRSEKSTHSQQSLPHSFLVASHLQPGSSKRGTLEGLHQVGPGPLRHSRVQRGRGLPGHTWGQEGGFQCAVQQRRVYTVGILDAGLASPCLLFRRWAQQSPLPNPEGDGPSLGEKGQRLSLSACPWTPPLPNCHIRPPQGFQVAEEETPQGDAWWRDIQGVVLCWEEEVPREGQGLAQSSTACQGVEQEPALSSLLPGFCPGPGTPSLKFAQSRTR